MSDQPTTPKPRARRTAKPKETPIEAVAAATAPRPTALTPDVLHELRRPFTVEAVRFKPQVVSKDKTKAMATFYIDARLVAERLNVVVGPENWSNTPRVLFESSPQAHQAFQFPVECALTIFGVTKTDVGVYQSSKPDDKALKSAYSDSLKRAGVLFGIGAYLYGFPKVWAAVETFGEGDQKKVRGFSQAGERVLRNAYLQSVASMVHRFGTPIDHGDLSDPETQDGATEPDAPPADDGAAAREASKAPEQKEHEQRQRDKAEALVTDFGDIEAMVALAKTAGYAPADIKRLCTNEHAAHGGYRRSWLTDQLQHLNTVIGEKAKAAA